MDNYREQIGTWLIWKWKILINNNIGWFIWSQIKQTSIGFITQGFSDMIAISWQIKCGVMQDGRCVLVRDLRLPLGGAYEILFRIRGKSLSGVTRPRLNILTLAQAVMFGGNPVLLITLRTSSTQWCMVVVASCCWGTFHRQGLGNWVEGKRDGAKYPRRILEENILDSWDGAEVHLPIGQWLYTCCQWITNQIPECVRMPQTKPRPESD